MLINGGLAGIYNSTIVKLLLGAQYGIRDTTEINKNDTINITWTENKSYLPAGNETKEIAETKVYEVTTIETEQNTEAEADYNPFVK